MIVDCVCSTVYGPLSILGWHCHRAGTPQPTEIPASAPEQGLLYYGMVFRRQGTVLFSTQSHLRAGLENPSNCGRLSVHSEITSVHRGCTKPLCPAATVTQLEEAMNCLLLLVEWCPVPALPRPSEDPTAHSHGSRRERELLFEVCVHRTATPGGSVGI